MKKYLLTFILLTLIGRQASATLLTVDFAFWASTVVGNIKARSRKIATTNRRSNFGDITFFSVIVKNGIVLCACAQAFRRLAFQFVDPCRQKVDSDSRSLFG